VPDQQSRYVDEQNEGIAASPTDGTLVRVAPLVLKTPTGAVREFRSSGPCIGGCEHQPGTPLPPDHYSHSYIPKWTRREP
jgi:hypothetical protein